MMAGSSLRRNNSASPVHANSIYTTQELFERYDQLVMLFSFASCKGGKDTKSAYLSKPNPLLFGGFSAKERWVEKLAFT